MASGWFKFFHTEYLADPKVKMLRREHRSDLVDLWCYCAQEGSVPDEPEAISRLLNISVAEARKTLTAVRPLFESEDGRLISPRMERERQNYERTVEARRLAGARGLSSRWQHEPDGKPDGNCHGKPDGKPGTNANELAMPKHSEAEAEAEAEADKDITTSTEVKLTSAPEPAVDALPCVGSGPGAWPITQRQLDEWRAAFPGVDPLLEVRKMKLWLMDEGNARRRKTYRGMGSFVLGWLNRAQNDPRGKAQTLVPTHRAPASDQRTVDQVSKREWLSLSSLSAAGSL